LFTDQNILLHTPLVANLLTITDKGQIFCSLYCGTTAIECEYIEHQPEKEISIGNFKIDYENIRNIMHVTAFLTPYSWRLLMNTLYSVATTRLVRLIYMI
jgi:hypothetical protein